MKILHLCNDFAGSTVHAELYRRLSQARVEQVVYCPIRDCRLSGNNAFEADGTEIIYALILKKIHRLVFHLKTKTVLSDVEKRLDVQSLDGVHATTLFSDGAVALRLKEKYGIPFIVAVRNSDVNVFMKFAPHLWGLHKRILRAAHKVVFVTPNLQKRFLAHPTLRGMASLVKEKSVIVPNGLNDFWLDNLHLEARNIDHPHSIVYVGRFDSNKNVERLIQAVVNLNKRNPSAQIHLDLVGGDGNREKEVLKMAQCHSEMITAHGKITDRPLLRSIYNQNSIFAMPSKKETFGLVYLEALSQGLNVLYTKNEGIDGLFDIPVGEGVNPYSLRDIEKALEQLLFAPEKYQMLDTADFCRFRWDAISQCYTKIYEEMVQKKTNVDDLM